MTTDTTTSSAPLADTLGRDLVTLVRSALVEAADALGDLDRRAGDGDFGTNVRTAMTHLDKSIDAEQPEGYRGWLTALYRAWLNVGGTSGPLFGMFFRELAKAADGDDADGPEADADPVATPSLAQLADALARGQATVQKYGEAEVGDKTMVDALDPAVGALREAIGSGTVAAGALAAAEQAAVDAALSTAGSTARRGRASYVGEAAQGVIDPGAAAMALVIGALRAAATGQDSVDTAWLR